MTARTWDAIVVGSGFGGVLAAKPLVEAGRRVLMLERGGWVARGPENWGRRGAGLVTPHYSRETPYDVRARGRQYATGAWHCVGGQSVFYGGASYRFRERDFLSTPAIVGDSGAEWPFDYRELEPYYAATEHLLGVAGAPGDDPTEPWRSAPYPQCPRPLAPSASRIAEAARRLGYHPSRIPLAISYGRETERRGCIGCRTCDGYACATEAKNDLATGIIPALIHRGMVLRQNTVCVRVRRDGHRVMGVECVDRVTGAPLTLHADIVVLAAGALATPHLLLSSGLDRINTAGDCVGRHLMRHRNAVVLGIHRSPPNPDQQFDKQIAINDLYDGASEHGLAGPLGCIQQLTPPAGLVRAYLPPIARSVGARLMAHASGLLVIAEDQPRRTNGVTIDARHRDRFGMPRLHVRHEYSARDEWAASILVSASRRILREAGATVTFVHAIETFSHALGTVRMGIDPATSPLDVDGRYRGLENLFVTDASALPRSAGVNPSLTIAANALRIGTGIVGGTPLASRRVLPTVQSSLHLRT